MYKHIETWDLWHYYLNAGSYLEAGTVTTEYPSLAILPMILPRLITDNFGMYVLWYFALMALCVGATSYFIHKAGKSIWWYLVIVLSLFPLIFGVYDLFVTLFFFFSVYLFSKKGIGHVTGSVSFLLSILLKLYPLSIIPLLLRYGRKSVFYVVAGLIAFGFLASDSTFISFHKDRTAQPESLYTNLLYVQGKELETVYSHNAMALKDVHVPILFTLSFLAFGVIRAFRAKNIYAGSFYSVLGFILGNGVFSPQYLIWLAPFVPFIKRRTQLLVMGASFLTMLYLGYYGQAVHFENPYYMILFLRNVLLLLAIVV